MMEGDPAQNRRPSDTQRPPRGGEPNGCQKRGEAAGMIRVQEGTRARATRLAIFALGVAALAGTRLPAIAQETASPPAALPGYTIGPADVLRIIVWREPDLTLEVTVRVDGMITFPLLGDLQAAGRG